MPPAGIACTFTIVTAAAAGKGSSGIAGCSMAELMIVAGGAGGCDCGGHGGGTDNGLSSTVGGDGVGDGVGVGTGVGNATNMGVRELAIYELVMVWYGMGSNPGGARNIWSILRINRPCIFETYPLKSLNKRVKTAILHRCESCDNNDRDGSKSSFGDLSQLANFTDLVKDSC